MADDSDIPPLEDMTEVLKQASAIRTGMLDTASGDKPTLKTGSVKDRAKVRKPVTAKAINLQAATAVAGQTVNCEVAVGGHKEKSTVTSVLPTTASATSSQPPKSTKASGASSGEVFGGLKKGFLFGGSSAASSHKKNVDPVKPAQLKAKTSDTAKKDSDIPFISPQSGKTQSDLTLDEVQQAMSEAKGLLDNPDWISDDLLDKVEKNELLLKRFADPHFMKALEEFQTNPVAAMEKYKGNKEVEKFLMEFCGLLGDHFTKLGDGSASTSRNTNPGVGDLPPPRVQKMPENLDKKPKPKIIELVDGESELVQFKEQTKDNDKKAAKITDIPDSEHSSKVAPELSLPKSTKRSAADIRLPTADKQADIQEIPADEDAKVKEVLNDPRVMETLLDPRIMNLIHLLQSDYKQAQRIVDTANGDFKEKITFLILKGLLKFQAD
ncbi:unnamed protein product [Candidula unifasciata]|uniref:STI1/HOP DP domain-containing protein n=1 Tax=Candidula unifasciata TaxID=100452 RepID=A0A8S3ZX27_9EUPU|nr:unnamed protein product [Candidula unifasciata]